MIDHATALGPLVTDATTALGLVGPPGGLPAPVPDFVGDLLGVVRSFVDGTVDHLGEVVRAVVPGGSGGAGGAETAPGR